MAIHFYALQKSQIQTWMKQERSSGMQAQADARSMDSLSSIEKNLDMRRAALYEVRRWLIQELANRAEPFDFDQPYQIKLTMDGNAIAVIVPTDEGLFIDSVGNDSWGYGHFGVVRLAMRINIETDADKQENCLYVLKYISDSVALLQNHSQPERFSFIQRSIKTLEPNVVFGRYFNPEMEVQVQSFAGSIELLQYINLQDGSKEQISYLSLSKLVGGVAAACLLMAYAFEFQSDLYGPYIGAILLTGSLVWLLARASDYCLADSKLDILCLDIFIELAKVLDTHQAHDLVHGDIKPDNIMLQIHHGQLDLTKGVALVDPDMMEKLEHGCAEPVVQGGTLLYLSPNMISEHILTVYTDQYAMMLIMLFIIDSSLFQTRVQSLESNPTTKSLAQLDAWMLKKIEIDFAGNDFIQKGILPLLHTIFADSPQHRLSSQNIVDYLTGLKTDYKEHHTWTTVRMVHSVLDSMMLRAEYVKAAVDAQFGLIEFKPVLTAPWPSGRRLTRVDGLLDVCAPPPKPHKL